METNIIRERWLQTSFYNKVVQLDTKAFIFNISYHTNVPIWLNERFYNRSYDYRLSAVNKRESLFKLYDILEFKNKSDAMEFKLRFMNT